MSNIMASKNNYYKNIHIIEIIIVSCTNIYIINIVYHKYKQISEKKIKYIIYKLN